MRSLLKNTRRRLTNLLRDIVTLGVVLPPERHEAEVISLDAHRRHKKDARAA